MKFNRITNIKSHHNVKAIENRDVMEGFIHSKCRDGKRRLKGLVTYFQLNSEEESLLLDRENTFFYGHRLDLEQNYMNVRIPSTINLNSFIDHIQVSLKQQLYQIHREEMHFKEGTEKLVDDLLDKQEKFLLKQYNNFEKVYLKHNESNPLGGHTTKFSGFPKSFKEQVLQQEYFLVLNKSSQQQIIEEIDVQPLQIIYTPVGGYPTWYKNNLKIKQTKY